MYDNPSVVCPFSPGKVEDNDNRDDCDDAARRSPYPSIFYRLREGVEPGKSRLGGHGG